MKNNDPNRNIFAKSIVRSIIFTILLTVFFNTILFIVSGLSASTNEALRPTETTTRPAAITNYKYYITTNDNGKLSHYKCNDYQLKDNLLTFNKLNSDKTTTECVVNSNIFMIETKDYVPSTNFEEKYIVTFNNGSYNETFKCDNVKVLGNNDIMITTNKKKLYIHGTYEIKTISLDTQKNIEDVKIAEN